VDPGAELERLAACLPGLAGLTLPAEWATGWAAPFAPAGAAASGPGPGPGPGAGSPGAAPLARLLLRCCGDSALARPPAIHVALPKFHMPKTEALDAAVWERIEGICAAARQEAGGRADNGGHGLARRGGAWLPCVERVFYEQRTFATWANWYEGGKGEARAAKRQRRQP
jgi:hypothetical protein